MAPFLFLNYKIRLDNLFRRDIRSMETAMHIYTIPDPTLNAVCEAIQDGEKEQMVSIAHNMLEQMYTTGGCGLAAPQIGLLKRLVVVDCEQDEEKGIYDPKILINPEIIEHSNDKVSLYEGCLSIPGVQVKIERSNEIVFKYENENGEIITEHANGLLARCVQHECDHLDGITMFEHLTGMKKMSAIVKYQAAVKQGASNTGENKVFYRIS